MSPQVRFLLVLSFLAFTAWVCMLLFGYVFGQNGLNFERYVSGIFYTALGLGAGYSTVLIILKYLNHRESRLTGFQAIEIDETGTKFSLKLSLSRFVPDILNPPTHKDISQLERELIGFLNSVPDVPFDLKTPHITLQKQSLALWEQMKKFEGATAYHRAAVLAANLHKVYVYKRIKNHKTGISTFEAVAHEHGGMSAFILSQMPAFKHLDADPEKNLDLRRGILTGVRYIQHAGQIPINSHQIAQEIYIFYTQALAHLQAQMLGEDAPTAQNVTGQDITNLQNSLHTILPVVLEALLQEDTVMPPKILAVNKQLVAVEPNILGDVLLSKLDAQFRTIFGLWDSQKAPKTLMQYTMDYFKQKQWLPSHYEGIACTDGLLKLTYQQNGQIYTLPPMILLSIEDSIFNECTAMAQEHVQKHAPCIEPAFQLDAHVHMLQEHAVTLNTTLRGLFPN